MDAIRMQQRAKSEIVHFLKCRRCGVLVRVPGPMFMAHSLGEPVVVECDRPCVRSVPAIEVSTDEDS